MSSKKNAATASKIFSEAYRGHFFEKLSATAPLWTFLFYVTSPLVFTEILKNMQFSAKAFRKKKSRHVLLNYLDAGDNVN